MTALLKGPRGFARTQSLSRDLVGFVTGYAIMVLVVAIVRPRQVLSFHLPKLPLLLLSPFVGIACILAEYLVGMLTSFLRTKKLVTSIAIHSIYSSVSRVDFKDIASVLAMVVGEELILRQLLYNLLAADFILALWAVISVCTLAYAVNHLAFGIESVIAKLPSGLLYVLLFYMSGLSILVVIVAHVTQNVTLLLLARKRS